jgi:two-component sensor histidine kinase
VTIIWGVGEEPEGSRLRLTWRESGGPAVSTPLRKGFGSRLIERSLTREHGGEVQVSYPASGLVCEIAIMLPKEVAAPGLTEGSVMSVEHREFRRSVRDPKAAKGP